MGNLVNRTVAMINKYFGGEIKEPTTAGEFDDNLKETVMNSIKKVEKSMETLHVADALDHIWTIVDRANKYIDETMPWALAKSEETMPRLQTVLYNLAESIRIIASLLVSFMPSTAKAIAEEIGNPEITYESIGEFGKLAVGTKVGEAKPLFARIDAEKKMEELAAEFAAAAEGDEPEVEIAPYKDYIEFEDFEKLDIRVGKVIECEKVPKSSKLLRFLLQVGNEKRQILSGISKYHKPEDMIGKNVVFIANLKPRKMMGLESCGMILSAEHGEELTALTTIKDIQSGAEIV